MKYMLFMGRFFFNTSFVLSVALAVLLSGCEGEKTDPTGAESYFKTNAYSSVPRDDPLVTTLKISPASAKIGIVGKEVVFTATGGTGSYYWALSNEDNGELSSSGANQSVYKCKQVGNNDVILTDDGGHYAAASITPEADAMTLTPSSVTLSSGSLYASFTVSGGTPPYTWTSGNASLGTVSYAASTSYTASYKAVAGAYGQNTITVRDTDGRIATATVTQSSD